MEIVESIAWVAVGFVPTLLLLETYDRLRRRVKKPIVKVTSPVAG